jgi:hypothetical protein
MAIRESESMRDRSERNRGGRWSGRQPTALGIFVALLCIYLWEESHVPSPPGRVEGKSLHTNPFMGGAYVMPNLRSDLATRIARAATIGLPSEKSRIL